MLSLRETVMVSDDGKRTGKCFHVIRKSNVRDVITTSILLFFLMVWNELEGVEEFTFVYSWHRILRSGPNRGCLTITN